MADDATSQKVSGLSPFALASDEDFFGFSEIPFDVRDFVRVQSDLFQKVEHALTHMEESLEEETGENREMLSGIMKISAWRNLRECLGASLQHKDERDELQKFILQCATIFYKELDHPYWSTTQFQYLLHLDSLTPTNWAGYGLCLADMAERNTLSVFRLDEKAAIAFIRAARLCLAHVVKKTAYFSRQPSPEKLIDQALRYYGNAAELLQTEATAMGAEICSIVRDSPPARDLKTIQTRLSEAQKVELDHILALKM